MTDNWDVIDELNIYLVGHAEYYRLKGKNLPYICIGILVFILLIIKFLIK